MTVSGRSWLLFQDLFIQPFPSASFVSEVSEEKDLGVIISRNFKVSKQCIKATKKGNQILGLIKRTFTCRKKEVVIRLYQSLVRPHLEYCIQAWRPHLVKDIMLLEQVQRRATKMTEECKGKSYEERLEIFRANYTWKQENESWLDRSFQNF